LRAAFNFSAFESFEQEKNLQLKRKVFIEKGMESFGIFTTK
jgi:hypothetical protein